MDILDDMGVSKLI